MAQIEYRTFHFIKPEILNDKDFLTLKSILKEEAKFDIEPSNNFFETFKGDFLVIGVGALGVFFAIININEWLSIFGAFLMIMLAFHLFRFIPSLFSFIGFVIEKKKFYKRLKKDIIKSNNYIEFIKNRTLK